MMLRKGCLDNGIKNQSLMVSRCERRKTQSLNMILVSIIFIHTTFFIIKKFKYGDEYNKDTLSSV